MNNIDSVLRKGLIENFHYIYIFAETIYGKTVNFV